MTVDFINPEAPWPALRALREATEAAGQKLVERLPVYSRFLVGQPDFFDPKMREALPRFATDDGFARSSQQSGEEAA